MSKNFVHIHSSSRYDRSVASLRAAVQHYTSKADLVTLTEVSRETREKGLIVPNWASITGDKSGWDDCAILYRTSRYKKVYSESFNMGGTGRWAQIAVLLDRLSNKRLVIASAHYPASVEPELAAKRRTADSVMWTKAVWSLKRRVNDLRRKHKASASFIAADWNINFKRPWANALIKSIHPLWKNSWKAPYPTGGTHGNRIIDATLYRGKVAVLVQARLMSDDKSSDHRPYINAFRWV